MNKLTATHKTVKTHIEQYVQKTKEVLLLWGERTHESEMSREKDKIHKEDWAI